MESIRSIAGLAERLGKPVKDLKLQCNFCRKTLTVYEKIIFTAYRFQLRWNQGQVFACCRSCMRLSSRIEFTGYFEKNIQVQDCFSSQGFSLAKQQIRCKNCLKPLTAREKNRLKRTREFIYQVRGRLRGICTLCRLAYNAR